MDVEIFETAEEMNTEDILQDKTKSDLQEEARQMNESRGSSPGDENYVPTSKTKQEIAERIKNVKKFNTSQGGALVESESEVRSLKLGQLILNPDNERKEADYWDPTLYETIKRTGEFTNTPKVRVASREDVERSLDIDVEQNDDFTICEDGTVENKFGTIYKIIAGNRSVFAFKRVVRDKLDEEGLDEIDPGARQIECMIRRYDNDADEGLKKAQELYEISSDNDVHLSPSPINRAKHYQRLMNLGMTQKEVSEQVGKYQTYISNQLRLLKLPERVQDEVHHEAQSSRFENMSTDQLENFNINYEVDDNDQISVQGITQSNAMVMLEFYPSSSDPDADQIELDIEDELISSEVLEHARQDTADEFRAFLSQHLVDEGILDESQTTSQDDSQESSTSDSEGSDEDDNSTSTSSNSRGSSWDIPYSANEAAEDLRSEMIWDEDMTEWDEFSELLADDIEKGVSGSLDLFKGLLAYGLIRDRDPEEFENQE